MYEYEEKKTIFDKFDDLINTWKTNYNTECINKNIFSSGNKFDLYKLLQSKYNFIIAKWNLMQFFKIRTKLTKIQNIILGDFADRYKNEDTQIHLHKADFAGFFQAPIRNSDIFSPTLFISRSYSRKSHQNETVINFPISLYR